VTSPPESTKHRRTTRIPVPRRDPSVAPGTLRAQPDAEVTRVRVWTYGPDGLDEDVELSPEAIERYRRDELVIWVSVVGSSDPAVFRELGQWFGIHPLALEDLISVHQRPKADDYDDHGLIVLRAPSVGQRLELQQIGIVLGHCFVISVQQHDGHWFEPIDRRLHSKQAKLRKRPSDYLVHALIDATLDSYLPVLEAYRDRLEAFEDRIFDDPDDATLFELHEVRHDLYSIRRAVAAMRDALADSVRGEETLFSEGLRVYLRDCEDHAAQLLDSVDACSVMATGLVELRNSQLNHRMNEVMKWLSLISTVFIPLSFIAGVYGMNFNPGRSSWNMPELEWPYGYPFALGLMLATTLGLLALFRYRGWLGRGGRRRRRARQRAQLHAPERIPQDDTIPPMS
jgi:magnesium transporter